MSNNSDQPAYPMYNELGNLHAEGLSKRELIAAMAMAGLLVNNWFKSPKDNAEDAVKYADYLLNELEKNK